MGVTTDGLLLSSASLLSKWGFNDGDMPDDVADYCRQRGIRYADTDWHAVLRGLVRTRLLPELQRNHDIELVDVETAHNPIRASVIDGVDVEDLWYGCDRPRLSPEYVAVPLDAVIAAVRG